jgi:hypothetical protein
MASDSGAIAGSACRRSIDEIAGLDDVRQKHLNFLCVVAVGNRLDRSQLLRDFGIDLPPRPRSDVVDPNPK